MRIKTFDEFVNEEWLIEGKVLGQISHHPPTGEPETDDVTDDYLISFPDPEKKDYTGIWFIFKKNGKKFSGWARTNMKSAPNMWKVRKKFDITLAAAKYEAFPKFEQNAQPVTARDLELIAKIFEG